MTTYADIVREQINQEESAMTSEKPLEIVKALINLLHNQKFILECLQEIDPGQVLEIERRLQGNHRALEGLHNDNL